MAVKVSLFFVEVLLGVEVAMCGVLMIVFLEASTKWIVRQVSSYPFLRYLNERHMSLRKGFVKSLGLSLIVLGVFIFVSMVLNIWTKGFHGNL